MFNTNRKKFITTGASIKIPNFIVDKIWGMIYNASATTELDYLQIFNLTPVVKDNVNYQHIVHKQEEPEYYNEIDILCDNPVTEKVYCIDDSSVTTMLLSSEY